MIFKNFWDHLVKWFDWQSERPRIQDFKYNNVLFITKLLKIQRELDQKYMMIIMKKLLKKREKSLKMVMLWWTFYFPRQWEKNSKKSKNKVKAFSLIQVEDNYYNHLSLMLWCHLLCHPSHQVQMVQEDILHIHLCQCKEVTTTDLLCQDHQWITWVQDKCNKDHLLSNHLPLELCHNHNQIHKLKC
jgi:hypothetical protein